MENGLAIWRRFISCKRPHSLSGETGSTRLWKVSNSEFPKSPEILQQSCRLPEQQQQRAGKVLAPATGHKAGATAQTFYPL